MELTMVMAITAIISAMIVSFSTLISAQTRKNNLRADFLESVMTLRTDLQKQFAEVDTPELNIENHGLSLDKEKYKYIDEIKFDVQGKIIKVTLTNKKLSESQSFTLISKVQSDNPSAI